MKKLLLCVVTALAILMSGSFSTSAASTKNLPISEFSNHWKVTIGKAEIDDLKAKKGVYNLYSVDVKNVGEKAYDPVFEVYRDEPNSSIMYLLSTSESLQSSQEFYHHRNLPVSSEAKKIEVVVTWREKPYEQMKDGRKYSARKFKQTFIFKPLLMMLLICFLYKILIPFHKNIS